MARPDPVRDEAAEHPAECGGADDQSPGRRAAEVIDGDERADHDVHADSEVAHGVAEEAGGEPAVARTSRQPSARSRHEALCRGLAYGSTRIAATKIALKRKLPASIANTQPAPATATIAPARAGPKTFVVLRDIEFSAFACCSRPALTVWGIERLGGRVEEARGPSGNALQHRELPDVRGSREEKDAVVLCVPSRTRSAEIITSAGAGGPPRRRLRA